MQDKVVPKGLGLTPHEFDMLQNLYYLRKEENCSDVVMSVFYSPV